MKNYISIYFINEILLALIIFTGFVVDLILNKGD